MRLALALLLVGAGAYGAFWLLVTALSGQSAPWGVDPSGEVIALRGKNAARHGPELVTVLTWNVAYGYGMGSSAYDFAPRPRAHFEHNLRKIANVIAAADADVVLLQEVDFHAARSFREDQLRWLANACDYPYAARAVGWAARYLPFPYWPPALQLGEMSSGGAILSRGEITAHEVIYHPKPAGNPWWYDAFYLARYSQVARIALPGGAVRVVNDHLEDQDEPARAAAAKTLTGLTGVDIIAGDMNATPDEATVRTLRAMTGMRDALTAAGVPDDAAATFPSDAPKTRIDHVLYAAAKYEVVEARVLTDAGAASDHLPILVVLRRK